MSAGFEPDRSSFPLSEEVRVSQEKLKIWQKAYRPSWPGGVAHLLMGAGVVVQVSRRDMLLV